MKLIAFEMLSEGAVLPMEFELGFSTQSTQPEIDWYFVARVEGTAVDVFYFAEYLHGHTDSTRWICDHNLPRTAHEEIQFDEQYEFRLQNLPLGTTQIDVVEDPEDGGVRWVASLQLLDGKWILRKIDRKPDCTPQGFVNMPAVI